MNSARIALEHWRIGCHRAPGDAIVRVYTPAHGHTAVDVITDDMPFLVDSCAMALDRHDLGVHLVVHPIVRVLRTSSGDLHGCAAGDESRGGAHPLLESWTHFEVDRETSPDILDAVRADIERVLGDVRVATQDWVSMLGSVQHVLDELEQTPPPVEPADLEEGKALLRWLADQHFTFLAYRAYDLRADGSLCPVPDSGLGLLRAAPEGPSSRFAQLPEAVRAKAHERTLLVLTKANARSRVHRPTYLDYIGVKRFDAGGTVIGEHRFLGLFTSSAYTTLPGDVPVLRRKVAAVIKRAGFLPVSHDAKDLAQILDTYPRDDLFQIDAESLYNIALGILHLQERRQTRLFVYREPYARFVSCLAFIPRDRFSTAAREQIGRVLTDAYGATSSEWNTRLSASVLARVHYVLHVDPATVRDPDEEKLEQQVAKAARAWVDDLREALVSARGEEAGLDLMRVWGTRSGRLPRRLRRD